MSSGPRRPPARTHRVAADALAEVTFTVNGTEATVKVPTRAHLADVLRAQLGLTGTHLGCEHGVCGMCTVLVDGDAARACLLLAVQCDGAEIITVEGLGTADEQHPLQRSFSAHHGLQCGFCTPGMLMSSYDLLANGAAGTAIAPEDLPREMSGVLCRCTGYRGILEAVADVAGACPDGVPPPGNIGPHTLVGRALSGSGSGGHSDVSEVATASAHLDPPTGTPSATVRVESSLESGVDAVWAVVSDVSRLVRCLPGAELAESLGDDVYRGRATVALGPVTLSFDGVARVLETDVGRHALRLVARGRDAGGSATQADIRLEIGPGAGGGSMLRAHADLHLSGRIAQFGRALAGDVSRRLFERFAAAVDESARTGQPPSPPTSGMFALVVDAVRDRVRRIVGRMGRRRPH